MGGKKRSAVDETIPAVNIVVQTASRLGHSREVFDFSDIYVIYWNAVLSMMLNPHLHNVVPV